MAEPGLESRSPDSKHSIRAKWHRAEGMTKDHWGRGEDRKENREEDGSWQEQGSG